MLAIFLATIFTYINAPVAVMREGPSEAARVDSQAIYSEQVIPLETDGDWVKIQTPDTYSGWVKKDALFDLDYKFIENQGVVTAKVCRCAAHLYGVKDTEFGPIKTLPFESKLVVINQFGEPKGRWLQVLLLDGTTAYIQRGDVTINPSLISMTDALSLSLQFLGLPYTWGGRSSFGYDCSGFVQMLYRQTGIAIPRNSKDQAAWEGFHEVPLDDLQSGDLIFFGKDSTHITHVGIYLGEGRYIHSTVAGNEPYIHINKVEDPLFDFKTARRLNS